MPLPPVEPTDDRGLQHGQRVEQRGRVATLAAEVRRTGEPDLVGGSARGRSSAPIVLPQVIVDAGLQTTARFLEFFAGRSANARTRAAYGRAVGHS